MLIKSEQGVAAAGTAASAGALVSAGACCVLPLVFAAIGVGSGALGVVVPYHWPLTIVSAVVIAVGWLLYWRRRRACAAGADCAANPPSRATAVMLSLATVFVAISALWPGFFEPPLMRLLGGA